MTRAAMFDIDGTICRGSLMESHFKALVKYKILPEEIDNKYVKPLEEAWQNREINYDTYLNKLVEVYTAGIRGISQEDAEFIAKTVINNDHKRLYTYTRDKIKEHKALGHKIILISGSPDFLVSRMAQELDADIWFGTTYLTKNGRYTGEIIPMWDSFSKHSTIERLEKYYGIDMENSYAYGDTNGDYLMLAKVGHPIAINPNVELIERLKESDFKSNVTVVVERKDTIHCYPLTTTDVQHPHNK